MSTTAPSDRHREEVVPVLAGEPHRHGKGELGERRAHVVAPQRPIAPEHQPAVAAHQGQARAVLAQRHHGRRGLRIHHLAVAGGHDDALRGTRRESTPSRRDPRWRGGLGPASPPSASAPRWRCRRPETAESCPPGGQSVAGGWAEGERPGERGGRAQKQEEQDQERGAQGRGVCRATALHQPAASPRAPSERAWRAATALASERSSSRKGSRGRSAFTARQDAQAVTLLSRRRRSASVDRALKWSTTRRARAAALRVRHAHRRPAAIGAGVAAPVEDDGLPQGRERLAAQAPLRREPVHVALLQRAGSLGQRGLSDQARQRSLDLRGGLGSAGLHVSDQLPR